MVDQFSDEIKNVRVLLEKTLAVLKLVNNEKIIAAKSEILKNENKRKVYELCDGKTTVKDMATALNTSQPNVSYHIASLLESGLLTTIESGGNRYYAKTLE